MKKGPPISIFFPLFFSGTIGSAATQTLHLERIGAALAWKGPAAK